MRAYAYLRAHGGSGLREVSGVVTAVAGDENVFPSFTGHEEAMGTVADDGSAADPGRDRGQAAAGKDPPAGLQHEMAALRERL